MDLLNKAVTVAMLVFVVSSTLAMGSGFTIRQIIEPLILVANSGTGASRARCVTLTHG